MPAYTATLFRTGEAQPLRRIEFLSPCDQQALVDLPSHAGGHALEIWLAGRLVAIVDAGLSAPAVRAVLRRSEPALVG